MKRIICFISVGLVIVLLSANAFSEEKEKTTFILPMIVITPSRMDTTSLKVPGSVSVITGEDIKSSNAQTVIDVLHTVAGLVVRDELGNSKAATVDMRGFGEASRMNVLVLINGRRINEIDLSGTDWAQISLDQVEKIEISRGAGSVLYGDNAVGGVINIITKKGEGKPKINLTSTYGSYDKRGWKGEVSGSFNKLSYTVNANHSDTNGYRENNALLTRDIGGRFNYDINELLKLNLDAGYHTDDFGLPGALSVSDITNKGRRSAKYMFNQTETLDYYVKLGTEAGLQTKKFDFGKLITDGSYRNREVESTANYGAFVYISENDITTWTLNPRYVFNLAFWEEFKNDLILGLDFFHAENDIHSGMVGSSKDDVEITKKTLGLYFLDEFTLFERFAIQLGYRYDWAKYRFYRIETSFEDKRRKLQQGVLTSGLSFYLTDDTTLYLTYAQSYRFPATDEYYNTFTGLNTELQPQEADHYEIGVKHYFSDIVYAAGNFFYMDVENEIYYDPYSWSNSNYDKTEHAGIEAEVTVKPLENLKLFLNYTYNKATFDGGAFNNNYIPIVPKHSFNVGGDFEIIDNLIFSLVSNYVGKRYLISDQRNQAPRIKNYFKVDTKLSYEIKGLKFSAGINNLFNERYSEVGVFSSSTEYFYPSPERNFIIEASFKM